MSIKDRLERLEKMMMVTVANMAVITDLVTNPHGSEIPTQQLRDAVGRQMKKVEEIAKEYSDWKKNAS